ncbi:MAG: succinate dehydrogenase assembly factor 2 [Kordiimonadaceae bacterium]|nr:succinate dehydrogenase assembly factor 2 [Kordiimonadaceae bacterium]MBO6570520.1 succinate dehydrogenase assembly factor 2 [Kordiimonadaceae bacterium]MBO6966361.1 succinate dehydrogenase assembly factor 2 [Kordiimonadaceae bacterium]
MTDLSYNPHKEIDLENRRRRLLFRAWHRGIKELDLIFGNFVEANVQDFSEDDCAWFESLFEEQDHEILAWVTKGENVPEKFQGEMMSRLQKLDFMVLKAR